MNDDEPLPSVRVWDLPTRLFHWLLAATLVGSVLSAKIGGNAMAWHFRFGYLVFGLLLFRLAWGLVGGYWSRFSSFLYGPRSVLGYLRGGAGPQGRWHVGHSPLGALSTWFVLAVLALQVASGLVADDDIVNVGPLNRFVSSALASTATGWHKNIGQWLILGWAGLHLLAVLMHWVAKKRDLVRPMWSGDKPLPTHTPRSADSAATRTLAAALALACAGLVTWVVRLGG